MRNVLVVLIVVFVASVAMANEPTVAFKYVNSAGVVSYTDDEKRVPKAYKAAAEQVTLGGLADYERFTPVTVLPVAVTAPAVQTAAPATKQDCGTVRVRSERRDGESNSGGDNTRFYIVEDDCGVLFDAPYYPDLNAVRR